MAIRVRKLARQLGRSPEDLLDLLATIGLSRYSRPDDMLPGPAAEALRDAVRDLPPPRQRLRSAPAPAPRQASPADLMSALVPGVERMDRDAPAPAPKPTPKPPRQRAAASDALAEERASLAAERAALVRQREELEALRAELDEAREQMQRVRREAAEELAAARQERARARELSLRAAQREDDHTFLLYLLHQRGLRGMDECERALAALAERRQLRGILEMLRCDRPDRVGDVLDQRLVLVGGTIPASLPDSLAAVSVAPDRADVPGERDLSRAIDRFGEILLLHGLRRVTVVGGRPAWHKALREGLDPRVELRFMASMASAQGMAPLQASDLAVLWDVEGSLERAQRGRGVVVSVTGDHLLSLLAGVEEFLRSSAA